MKSQIEALLRSREEKAQKRKEADEKFREAYRIVKELRDRDDVSREDYEKARSESDARRLEEMIAATSGNE